MKAPAEPPAATDAVVIEVVEEGIHQVTASALQAVGFDAAHLDIEDIQLSQAGQPVPFLVQGDSILFYGQASDDRYYAARPYILKSGSPGRPMEAKRVELADSRPASTVLQKMHLEEDRIYLAESASDPLEDVWFWERIGQGQKLELNVSLPQIGPQTSTLRMRLYGNTHNPQVEGDHDFDLFLNGEPIETIRWDGQTSNLVQVDVPAGVLTAGDNLIAFDNEVIGNSFLDIMTLDWVELEYAALPEAQDDRLWFTTTEGKISLTGFSGQPIILDITDVDHPRLIEGWEYRDGQAALVAENSSQIVAFGPSGFFTPGNLRPYRHSDWSSSTNQADFIIVAVDEMTAAMQPLAVARQRQGLRTVTVALEEIYDEFGYGAASPDSISAFVAYAYSTWRPPRPNYLLLVGDATLDYRNNLGNGQQLNVPSPMVPVEFGGETVSDARMADVDADGRPELAVGRWPVSSLDEVRQLVERTLAYEQGNVSELALFAADGTEPQFADLARSISDEANFASDQSILLDGPSADELVGYWNDGAWLATYVGHGSVQRWGKDDVFDPAAVARLRATQNPPIVLQLTCLTGLFAHPEIRSLSEMMLLHEQGPVLLIAATSLTLSSDQEALARPLLKYLQDLDYERIGDAFQAAKETLNIDQSPGLREISDTYVLLGDPSALIMRPNP